jgi:epoxyqueuosine reductase QueG
MMAGYPGRNGQRPAVNGRTIDRETLKQQILNWGATIVGFGDVSQALVPELRHLPVAISMAIANSPTTDTILQNGAAVAYSHQSSAIEAELESIQRKITRTLRQAGQRFFPIPPNSHKPDRRFAARLYTLFPHKTAATCAGLGWVGKSGLLINKRYGPHLTWATVITNAPLLADKPTLESYCKTCVRCVDYCPPKAIHGLQWHRDQGNIPFIDLAACSEQLQQNKHDLDEAVCGLCVLVCPFGPAPGNPVDLYSLARYAPTTKEV